MTGALLGGRWVLGRELGRGGFAIVHEATDSRTGRRVAVKLVPPAYRAQRDVCERLVREGRIASMLDHPNVCAVVDTGWLAEGTPFIVMERLEGETLASRIGRGRIPHSRAASLLTQILYGLGAAHAAGVIHRDVKPANVFVVDAGAGDGVAKLLNFGLARVEGADFDGTVLTGDGVVVGTAAYMSPEQVRGVRDLDARTDVYSVAVLAYEMFTGRRPFHDVPRQDLFDAIAHRKPAPLAVHDPTVPAGVARAIDAALAVNREHRPRDARAFLERLDTSARRGAGAGPEPDAKPDAKPDDWDVATWQGSPVNRRGR